MNLTTISQASLTMTSREIAELTGKELAHVHRDIRAMLDELKKDDPSLDDPKEDKDARGYTTCFYLSRELTETLLTGYSASARLKVIRRWHVLEDQQATKPALELPQDYIQALEQLLITKKSEQAAIEQRDHAIATKAQIGSKREATAMANVAKANREVSRLMDRLGFNTKHATVKAVEGATKRTFGPQGWRPLSEWCKTHGVSAVSVPDPLYGSVKSWPADAWGEIYGVDLSDLFSEKESA